MFEVELEVKNKRTGVPKLLKNKNSPELNFHSYLIRSISLPLRLLVILHITYYLRNVKSKKYRISHIAHPSPHSPFSSLFSTPKERRAFVYSLLLFFHFSLSIFLSISLSLFFFFFFLLHCISFIRIHRQTFFFL